MTSHRWQTAALALTLLLTGCWGGHSPETLLARAERNIAAEEWRAAAIDLKTLLQTDPRNAKARQRLGLVSLEMGDFAGAAREIETARTLGATEPDTALIYSRALMGLKRYPQVLDAAKPEAVASAEERVQLWQLRAQALAALSRKSEALAAFDQAVAIAPQDVDALIGRALIINDLTGLADAKQALDRAAAAAPNDGRVAIALGTLYSRNHDYVKAEELYAKTLASLPGSDPNPTRIRALAGLAEAQLALNKLEAARLTTQRLLESVPDSRIAVYLRARYLLLNGEYEEAQTLLEQLLARDSDFLPARLLLGAVNYAQGDFGQADMHLSSLLAAEPDNEFARILLANSRLRQQKPRAALDAVSPQVKRGDPRALVIAGEASIRAGDVDTGLKYLERNVAADPQDPARTLALASGYIAAKRFDRAIQLLEQLPPQADTDYRRTMLLIAAHLRSRDLKSALHDAQSLVDSHPDDAFARSTLGGLLAASGDLKSARAQFERAAELKPDNALAQIDLARVDLAEKRTNDAQRRLDKALALGPNDPAVLVACAQVDMLNGKPDSAIARLKLAREHNPRAVEPRVLLAQYHFSRREYAQAAALASEALEIAPDEPAALNILGFALAANGDLDQGLPTLKRAAERNAGSANAQLNLARMYMVAGRPTDALVAARASLAISSDDPDALAVAAAASAQGGDVAAAKGFLARLRAVDAANPALFLIEGQLAAEAGDFAKAAKIYSEGAAKTRN